MRGNIKDSDDLGRAVFSASRARRAQRGHTAHDIFLTKQGRCISVDRFGFCPEKELADIQDQNAKGRQGQKFHGWAKLPAGAARLSGREAQPAAEKNNPYHADIILPEGIERDERISHAKELASHSEWLSRSAGQ